MTQNPRTSYIPVWAGVLACTAMFSAKAEQPPVAPRAILDQYCVGCHNQKVKTADISVQGLDPAHVGQSAGDWEKILRKVKAGQMPPAKLPRPQAAVNAAFTQWLEQELDNNAVANPNPGRPTIHRLNRAEYSNAVRDLLALDIKPGSKLPADDTGYGFDNIGDVLSLSPVLIERYMSVGRMVSRLAVGDATRKAEVNEFESPRVGKARAERVSDDLPFDSAGGLSMQYQFPVDAEYVFRIKMPVVGSAEPKVFEERLPVKAGTRTVAVTFLADNSVPEVITPSGGQQNAAAAPGGRFTNRPPVSKMDLRLDGARIKLFDTVTPRFTSVAIAGPYNVQGLGDSDSRKRIFTCRAQF